MNKQNPLSSAYHHQLRTRICGICIQQDKLLLAKHQPTIDNKEFWAPPGGGLNYGEKMNDCLKREFREETGLEIEVGRYLFVNEFIKPPLHAIEYFFEVNVIGGKLDSLIDSQKEVNDPYLEAVEFLSLPEINKVPLADKHRILHHLYSLDDLLGMGNHFEK